MESLRFCLSFVLIAVVLPRVWTFECSNKCSQQDATLSCWNETQRYYGQEMVDSISDYIAARLQFGLSTPNQQQWNEDQQAIHNYEANVKSDVLDRRHFLEMMAVVRDRIRDVNKTLSDATVLNLNFTSCPTEPCDSQPEPMTGLFGASLALNIVLILAALVYFVIQEDWNHPKSFLKRKDVKLPSWSW